MKNIKQYTNFSSPSSIVSHNVIVKDPISNKTLTIEYMRFTIEDSIIKFGYCCGDGLIQCPIYLKGRKDAGSFPAPELILIGKTGMLEYQEEPIDGELAKLDDFTKGGIFDFPYKLTHINGTELPPEKQIYFTQTFDYTIETN